MKILTILVVAPLSAMCAAIYGGTVQTLCDWLDEKSEERKALKEAKKIRKEREKLWEMYLSLPPEC